MSEASELAGAASSADPAIGLRAALALRKLAESLERLQVQNARARGWSWQDIAIALQVSKQAVHKRYSGAWPNTSPNTSPAPGPSAAVVKDVPVQPDSSSSSISAEA